MMNPDQPQSIAAEGVLSISGHRIAVVIPSYNVENYIGKVLSGVPDFVEKIIVVDDASTDGTFSKASSYPDDRVIVLRHERNRGVGGAMLTGYQKAFQLGMDIAVKMDGDDQMRAEHIIYLVRPLLEGRASYARGNRFSDYRTLNRMPPLRRFGNAWLSFLSKFASGYWNIYDVTNGFTAITAESFGRVDPKHIASGYFFETSMLIELNINGAAVSDVDMPSVYGNESSNIVLHHVVAKFPLLLAKGFVRRIYQRYFIRDFSVLSLCLVTGLPLFLFGLFYGLSLWIFPPSRGNPTPAGTVMLAALPIILGFQLILTALILDVVFTPRNGTRPSSR